jgi:uncharacterized membrane protein HdeD (DUF308 family)
MKEGLVLKSSSMIHVAKNSCLVLSVCYILFGLACIFKPDVSSTAITKALALIWMVTGLVKILSYFSEDQYQLAFQYDLGLGLLMIIVGLVLFSKVRQFTQIFSVIAGIAVLMDAFFKIQLAMDAKEFGIERWWVILSLAAVTALTGIVLVFAPVKGMHLIMLALGLALICAGALNLSVLILAVKIRKQKEENIYTAEYIQRED